MKIIRIISVEDTRQWEEGPDDRWYPVPGSGIENNCGRCGRLHEVHATVELENQSVMIVGTGCMTADETEFGNRIRSVLAVQKTLKKNLGMLVRYEKLDTEAKRIRAQVDAMPLPPVEKTSWMRPVGRKEELHGFKMGDVRTSSGQLMHPTENELSMLVYDYKRNMRDKLGMSFEMSQAWAHVGAIKARIKRAEEKIAEKLNNSVVKI